MFQGMRGTGDWVPGQRPLNWRQQILYLYPNGTAPLTAMLSMLSEQRVDDPQYNWWTELMTSVTGAVTRVFTMADLSVVYAGGGVTGDTLFLTVTAALANRIRVGHQLLLRDASDYRVDVIAKVTGVNIAAIGVIAVRLLQPDNNAPVNNLSNCDNLLVTGNINPEGGEMPDAVALNPTLWYNYTQIFRTPLEITRTARRTRLRTGNDYQKAKREALEMHSIEMELAFLWGIRTQNIGTNGKPERTTMGMINWIRTGAPGNVDDFTINPVHAGRTWIQDGEIWMDAFLEQIFRYGTNEKMIFAGSGALLGVNRLAKQGGQILLRPTSVAYGLKVNEWITPFGTVYMKTHPLFSFDPTTRNMMVVFEPKDLMYRYVDDTTFFADKEKQNTGHGRIDGTKEEYLTECGLEFHHPQKFGMMNGVGLDSALP